MTAMQPGWYPDPTDATRQRWWDGNSWSEHVAQNGTTWVEPLTRVRNRPKAQNLPVWVWVPIAVVGVSLAILLSPLVVVIALAVLVTAIVGVTKGTPTWLRLNSRPMALGVLAASAAVFLLSGSVSAAVFPRDAGPEQTETDVLAGGSDDEAAPVERVKQTPVPAPTSTPVATTRDETVTEAIPFGESTVRDGSIPSGETRVTTPGQDGERTVVHRVHLLDGVEVSREVISDSTTREPVSQVTSTGTYVAPPPPPPPAAAPPDGGCDSNYADACVPIASDVDCAGGSGDGPAYFDGIARIVGGDPYDLDRDNDGYACEP